MATTKRRKKRTKARSATMKRRTKRATPKRRAKRAAPKRRVKRAAPKRVAPKRRVKRAAPKRVAPKRRAKRAAPKRRAPRPASPPRASTSAVPTRAAPVAAPSRDRGFKLVHDQGDDYILADVWLRPGHDTVSGDPASYWEMFVQKPFDFSPFQDSFFGISHLVNGSTVETVHAATTGVGTSPAGLAQKIASGASKPGTPVPELAAAFNAEMAKWLATRTNPSRRRPARTPRRAFIFRLD